MQGLVLQLTRVGFLLLLWLFIWSVLRILRTDIYAPTGAVMVRRGLALRGSLLPNRQRRHVARLWWSPTGAGRYPHHLGQPARADRPGRRLDAGAHRRLRLDAARQAVAAGIGMVCRGPRIDQRHIP